MVAGEPEEIHLRVNSDPYSEVLSNDEATIEAIEDQRYKINNEFKAPIVCINIIIIILSNPCWNIPTCM